ncbi:hypothetical protein BC835DRAFT_753967 [Cytidiella melzeri]|nr:hypothetical protein BC835DRAFT_753967 [Cytidiella melzeri]
MFASSFLSRSPTNTSRPKGMSATFGPAEHAAAPTTNTSSDTRSRTSSSSSTSKTAEIGLAKLRAHDKGSLLGDVSKLLRAQMRARAHKAASSATSSAYSSTSSLSSVEVSTPTVTPRTHPGKLGTNENEFSDGSTSPSGSVLSALKVDRHCVLAGVRPFPSSLPLATPRLGPSTSRSKHSSIKSYALRPSRSKSSRWAESLTRSPSKSSKPAVPISSLLAADLLTSHLAPLPRFDPFEKRRRSESLSAIVRKDSARGYEMEDGLAPSKACRRMSSWTCLRAARKSDGCAPSIHFLAL